MLLRSPVSELGPYTLHGQIAAGGMASVHLATHKDTPGTIVALKLVHDHLDEDEFLKRFIQEAKLCQRIDHPNVCSVLDQGEQEGLHYLVMEYLHGGTFAALLRALRKSGGWKDDTLPILITYLVDVLHGVHAAHELKNEAGEYLDVVHRDLSPANVFVTFDGSTKVLDFGIAKARNALHKSVTGELRGTIAYMSPEQASALPVDRRADVWSIGVILWELLTMQRLFRRDNDVATLKAVLQETPEAPSKSNPDCPPVFDEVCLSALQRSVGQRPSTAKSFADELENGIKLMGWERPSESARTQLISRLLQSELKKSAAKLEEVASLEPETEAFVTAQTTTPASKPERFEAEASSSVEVSEPKDRDPKDEVTRQSKPRRQSKARESGFQPPPFEVPLSPGNKRQVLMWRLAGLAVFCGIAILVLRATLHPTPSGPEIPLPAPGPLHPAAYGNQNALPPPPQTMSAIVRTTGTQRASGGRSNAPEVFRGFLDETDEKLDDGRPYDVFRFYWNRNQRIRIEVDSATIDTALLVVSPAGRGIEVDNMSSDYSPLREWNAGGVFPISETGRWTVMVAPAYAEHGNYTLRIDAL